MIPTALRPPTERPGAEPGGRPAGSPPDRPERPARPGWGAPAQLGVAVLAGALYLSNLSVNGLGNPYYAAAVKSGSVSWKAFFFGSLDPGSFITVDKPPAAFWVQAISVRIFGFSSWSLLVPEAIAGVAAVAVTYHVARRLMVGRSVATTGLGAVSGRGAEVAGILAGLGLAVTPMAAVMFRFNDPDALLTLFLALAAWAGWVAIERGTIRHLVAAGVLIGFAFLSKELVAAVVVPGLALAWIVAAPVPFTRRLLGWLWSGLALVVSAGWWVAIVALLPASDRPFIGSSTNNSIVSVIFGYNGVSRLFGNRGSSGSPGGGAGATGGRGGGGFGGVGNFGGSAGWTRMFETTLGSQISWLLPLAALGLVFGLVSTGRAPRTDRRRAGYLLWGGWAAAGFVVFSKSSGTFHPYYVVAIAPPIAVLAAAGAVELWAVGRRRPWLSWLLPAGIVGSGLWAKVLLDRTPTYHPWLRWAVLVASIVAALALLAAALLSSRARRGDGGPEDSGAALSPSSRRTPMRLLGVTGAVVGVFALLGGPTAWSLSSVTHGSNGTNPTAGPASATTSGFGGSSRRGGGFGGLAFDFRDAAATPIEGGGAPPAGGGFGAPAGGRPDGSAGGLPDLPAGGLAGGFGGGRTRGFAGAFGGGASSGPTAGDKSFVKWLEANRDGAKYLVAVDGSMTADDLIIASGKPVMAMGGFSGRDPSPTLAQFEKLVSGGKIRYVLVGGTGGFGGGGGGGTVSTVESWVEAHGTVVPTSTWGGGVSGTLYEVTPTTVTQAK